jgi:hypothetical protein
MNISLPKDAGQVLGSLLDGYESSGNPCFKTHSCKYFDTCNYARSSRCKYAKKLQDVKMRLFVVGQKKELREGKDGE